MSTTNKPGVMIYFDVVPALEPLSNSEKGKLFQAILNYGQYGEVPELPPKLRILWPMLTSRMDMDNQRYQRTVIRRKYAAYTRWENHMCRRPLPLVDWMRQEGYEDFIQEEDFHAYA